MSKNTFLIVDGSSLIHRAFFALPVLNNARGEPTNAIYGMAMMLSRFLEQQAPDYAVICFDKSRHTFRTEKFIQYKSQRQETPPELKAQFEPAKRLVEAMGMVWEEIEGYEADDIIGTLAKAGAAADMEIMVLTGDKDALQLIDERIHIYMTQKGITDIKVWDFAALNERYHLKPAQIIDLKGLMGDSSDNIPGVPGIGEKTALKLLAQYPTMEEIYEHLAEIQPAGVQKKLAANRELAFLSKELATVYCDVPGLKPLSDYKRRCDKEELRTYYHRMNFQSLLRQLEKAGTATGNAGATSGLPWPEKSLPAQAETGLPWLEKTSAQAGTDLPWPEKGIPAQGATGSPGTGAPLQGSTFPAEDAKVPGVIESESGGNHAFWGKAVVLLQTAADITAMCEQLKQAGIFGFWLDWQGNSYDGEINGCGFALPDGTSWGLELMGGMDAARLGFLKDILADGTIKKALFAAKEVRVALAAHGLEVAGAEDDVVLASYLLNPAESRYDIKVLAAAYLNAGEEIGLTAPLWQRCGGQAALLLPLAERLKKELEKTGMYRLYREVELPLTFILADMELQGVRVDGGRLKEMAAEFLQAEQKLSLEIYRLAGREFNLNSPKQLGTVLFEDLNIPPLKKTKTGYSTDAEVLELLAADYEIARLLLQYRTYFKLRTTYAQGLPALIKADGKIHTSFNQTVTATGRLSSAEPNLQNIPVRDELGRKIRSAFVTEAPEHVLLAVDYSQIELRVLAHISDDDGLCQAFLNGEDIHARTAAEVFGIPIAEVSREQRRRAKAVNFGIVYGISDFGLSRDLGIPRAEAKDYIQRYLARYPQVAAYMKNIVEEGRQKGYVSTLMGRRRYLPDLNSRNGNIRSFAQRMALNTPIQGTAADILKIAMVNLAPRLKTEKFQAKLLLQVHDELIFEAPEREIIPLAGLLEEVMTHPVELRVPLVVDLKVGADWYSMKKLSLS